MSDVTELDALKDALNACARETHEGEHNRYLNGQRRGCGATFLVGLQDAEVHEPGAIHTYYLCFWCFDRREPDELSQFHYGRC